MYKTLLIFLLLFVSVQTFALKPSKKYEAIPDTLKIPFEKNDILTLDKVNLKSWTFLPTKEADNHTTLVFAYADAGNMSWWLMHATILAQSGFTVVMFDYRGFGESDSFAIDSKMLYYNEFATDLSTIIKFAKTKYPNNKTGIISFSMGTVIATLATQYCQPDFIIGEGYVTSLVAIKSYYAKKSKEIILPKGAESYEKTLKDLKQPILIFSGKKDEVTTLTAVKKLKTVKPQVTLVEFEGGHMEGFSVLAKDYPGSVYIEKIEHFLKIQ